MTDYDEQAARKIAVRTFNADAAPRPCFAVSFVRPTRREAERTLRAVLEALELTDTPAALQIQPVWRAKDRGQQVAGWQVVIQVDDSWL